MLVPRYAGSRIRTTRRGLSTRREALRWEKEFILKKEGAANMTMAAFYELYEA
ncbi:Arm DNA-binding domain-containing protein [Bifidobacterium pullorum subsp. saeculare]|uniref:Arm DNA-binding domain-containing protein n=1 Tax=Bifidobacterium pullorum TaxID=78448 RepID=UPI001D5D77EF|nr:Arm DNA-binding domain-containing protein [Bifidobacterium pullorum subsp. saeculare]